MALLKAPSKQPKTTMLQVRLEEEVRLNLDRYAEFLDANPSYVVSEMLKLLYRKDKAFQSLAFRPTHQQARGHLESRISPTGTEIEPYAPSPPIRYA